MDTDDNPVQKLKSIDIVKRYLQIPRIRLGENTN